MLACIRRQPASKPHRSRHRTPTSCTSRQFQAMCVARAAPSPSWWWLATTTRSPAASAAHSSPRSHSSCWRVTPPFQLLIWGQSSDSGCAAMNSCSK